MSEYLPERSFRQALRQRRLQVRRQRFSEAVMNGDIDDNSPLVMELRIIDRLIRHYLKLASDDPESGLQG